MCTRFVFRGNDAITGFHFDIDLDVWKHRVIKEKERFSIGILRPDGRDHSYHGVNQNGNVATLVEQFIKARLSYDDVLQTAATKRIVYAPDAAMQAMFSDARGRTQTTPC